MDFDLDGFIGCEITCSIQLDGAGQFLSGRGRIGRPRRRGRRQINALITDASRWGEEGRHVQYKLTLRPWLHLATLTTDCKIFQNKTVVQILDELLADYDFPVDKRLIETYPPRDYQVQFNESDFAFFERLCQEWGISYFFEHSDGKHRLVLIDNMGAYKKNDSAAYQEVEYHAPGWKVDAEYIHSFVPHNQLTSGRYASRDYDYTGPRADLSIGRSDPRPPARPTARSTNGMKQPGRQPLCSTACGQAEPTIPRRRPAVGAAAHAGPAHPRRPRARASGNLRGMVPGCSFQAAKASAPEGQHRVPDPGHPLPDRRRCAGQPDRRCVPSRKQQWKVEVDFTAHPMAEPLRPLPTQPSPSPVALQSALVVGPAGQNIWTDELRPHQGAVSLGPHRQKDQHSTCWIRVTSPWAGNQLGSIQIPRIGQEVVVDFIGGDPDLPICTGAPTTRRTCRRGHCRASRRCRASGAGS
jgi:type VI secretion system secreted protein VgrG